MFKFDLHIHSCLSPCGSLDASPQAIARAAAAAGLHGIMLADHNSARNCPALAEACSHMGLGCLFGMEVTTAEEVHCLAVFDTLEQAAAMTDVCYAALPRRVNDPEVFGYQAVVDVDDNVEELEWRLLGAPTSLELRETGRKIHEIGGLFIAAHIDRPVFSVTSQLGALAGDEGFDAVELSRHARREEWLAHTCDLPVVRFSDAHYIEDIGTVWSESNLVEFSVKALKAALTEKGVGWGRRVSGASHEG